jgi:hypothetical protein
MNDPAVDTATTEKPRPHWYTLGLDFGQSNDHTALALIEADYLRKPVYRLRGLHRYPLGTPYTDLPALLEPRLNERPLAGRVLLALDATGVGKPVVDLFRERLPRPPIYAITITAGNDVTGTGMGPHVPKRDLILTSSVIFEQHRIQIAQEMHCAQALVDELQGLRRSITEHGNDTYSAASGEHDDLVLALSLALWTAEHKQPPRPYRRGISVSQRRIPTADDMMAIRLSRLYGRHI